MIKIEKTEVFGFEGAIRGMRNPKNSWDKSDSGECPILADSMFCDEHCDFCKGGNCVTNGFLIGDDNDLPLAKKLIKSGSDHRKFMRMIHVQADVTAPLYWWKEADQFKVGTVTNSCSTMHTIHKREITLDDFSHEHLIEDMPNDTFWLTSLNMVIWAMNKARECYLETKDKTYWWQIIQLLPSSYNQLRTIDLNYEVLLNIYHQRKNHKLDEWRELCKWIETLPYMRDFLGLEDE